MKDTLAAGVLMTRTVASAGGDEFREVEALRTLQQSLGQSAGLGAFEDLRWQRDQKASVTVPPEEGRFAGNDPVPAAKRAAGDQGQRRLRPRASRRELASGPGTGAAAVPEPPIPAPALPWQRRLRRVRRLPSYRRA